MGDDRDEREVDPREFVRSVLHISPEDAEKVRDATPGTRKPREGEPLIVTASGDTEAQALAAADAVARARLRMDDLPPRQVLNVMQGGLKRRGGSVHEAGSTWTIEAAYGGQYGPTADYGED